MSVRCALIGVVIAGAPAVAQAEDCVVTGANVTLERVLVQPAGKGHDALELALRDLPVTATIRRSGHIDLEVGGAISFKATARDVWWTVAEDVTTPDRLVALAAGAHLVRVRPDGDAVLGDAVVHAMDVMQGEAKDPDEHVGRVRVPCATLTLDWVVPRTDDAALPGDDTMWRPKRRPNQITLRAEPKPKARAVTYIAPGCEGAGCIHVERVSSRAGWFLVTAANEGVQMTGWVRRSELARIPEHVGVGHAYGCTGDHGRGTFGHSYAPGTQTSAATIAVGTVIHAGPNAGAWATVVKDGPYRVAFVPGDAWAAITSIPGVAIEVAPAYVPMSTVTLVKKD